LIVPMVERMSDIGSDRLPASVDAVPDPSRRLLAGGADPLSGLVDAAVEPIVGVALQSVRELLGMEVAYVSEIVGEDMVLRELDGDGESFGMADGLVLPAQQTYCQRMLDGRIPNLIADVRGDDRLARMPVTQAGNIGAFATVPLTLTDGRLYGTLCAASHDAKPLDYQGLQFLKVFARLIADRLELEATMSEVRELAALVDAADDAIVGVTPAGVVTSWNPACERMFEYPAAEAIGVDIAELIAIPGQQDGMRRALAMVAAGEAAHQESRRQRKDGQIIDVAVTLSPIHDEQGNVTLISAMVRDISAQVRQARYRAVERDVIGAQAEANDAAEAAASTLRVIGEGLYCDFAVLWETDEAEEQLSCSALWVNEHSCAPAFAQSTRERTFELGEGIPGRVWATGEVVWIEDLAEADADASPRAAAAAAAGLRSAVGLPLRSAGELVGVVEFFTRLQTPRSAALLAMGEAVLARLADALGRHHALAAVRAAREALEVRVRERTSELQHALQEVDAAQIETVHRLSRAVEFRDEDTGEHIARISALATRIAQRAGLDGERCALIERASPLHDVGKVAIPDNVLLKPGPLSTQERTTIETHAEIGYQLLDGSDSPVLQLAATIALSHHERYDGQGYPHGLAGEHIPIEGRIVAIADVFDALTSDRVYRPAMSIDRALSILKDGRGTHFDPTLLDHFLADLKATGNEILAIGQCSVTPTACGGMISSADAHGELDVVAERH
jgi:putative two-component system response regulator